MSNDDKRRPSVWDEMFPGRFLRAGLFKGKPVTLTIKDVTLEELPTDKGTEQTRGILSFRHTPKQLAINKTNGLCLRAMFGKVPAEWIGKRVTFVPELDKFGKETVDAIRIQGSPDIQAPIDIEIRMPKRKPKTRRLNVTSNAAPKQQERQPEPQPPSTERDPSEDGPPDDYPPTDFGGEQESVSP